MSYWGNRKPDFGLRCGIDWGHPLARGLVGYLLFNEGAGVPQLGGRLSASVAGTGYTWQPGGVLTAASGTESLTYTWAGAQWNPGSSGAMLLAKIACADTSQTNKYPMTYGYGSGESAVLFGYTARAYEHWKSPRFHIATLTAGDLDPRQVGWERYTSNDVRGFYEGRAAGTGSDASAPTPAYMRLGESPVLGSNTFSGRFEYLYLWQGSHMPGPDIAAWLHAEPYAMFEAPPLPVFYSIPAGGSSIAAISQYYARMRAA